MTRTSGRTEPSGRSHGRLAAFTLLILVLAGCGGGLSGSTATRPRPTVDPVAARPAADPLAAPWIVLRSGAPSINTIEVTAVIESRADSASEILTDSLRSRSRVSWSIPSRGMPRRLVGSVTEFGIGVVADSFVTPSDVSLPIAFATQQVSLETQPVFTSPDGASCGSTAAIVVQGARDLWISLPDTLGPEMRWADSSRYVVCRDSIPLTMRVRREFRVTGAEWRDSAIVATIERRSETSVAGTGRQFGDSVTFSGEGSGRATLQVSLRSGAIVSGSGDSELRMRLRGSRRTQELTQRSRIEIRDR